MSWNGTQPSDVPQIRLSLFYPTQPMVFPLPGFAQGDKENRFGSNTSFLCRPPTPHLPIGKCISKEKRGDRSKGPSINDIHTGGDSADRLLECYSREGQGFHESQLFADVIAGWCPRRRLSGPIG